MMNGIRKKVLSIVMLLMILQSFIVNASIVSDNDGSAFVTKAEFDALKNSFNKQIDDYNNSIDGKIDGAIASYLAGIQLSETEDRPQLIKGATAWTMYGSDYPQYQDGIPYVTGFTAQGHHTNEAPASYARNTFLMCTFNGDSNKKTNGGFKKHIVGKPSQNTAKNGNGYCVAEWQGYYEKESEQISCAYFAGAEDGVWAVSPETVFQFDSQVTFANAACPRKIANCRVRTPDGSGYTTYDVYCSAAQRLPGKMLGDTCVSIYKPINDNRFYDFTTANRVGITATNPAITYKAKSNNFTNIIKQCIPTTTFDLANGYYYKSGAYWKANSGIAGFTADQINFYARTTVNNYSVQDANREYYFWKMANDPNNLQFDRLWSAKTDSIATTIESEYNSTTISSTRKDQLKKALLWDSNNVAHLSMGAGYPFLNVEEEEKVDYTFSISDGTYTGDFYVFGKYGPFSSTGDPETEADVVFTNGGTVAAHPKAFKITANTLDTLKFDVTQTDNIFLKWVKASNMTGGGKMDTSNNPRVILKQD